jgi:hypothetical protein
MQTWTRVVPYDRASEVKRRGNEKPRSCLTQLHVGRILTHHEEKNSARSLSMKVVAVK